MLSEKKKKELTKEAVDAKEVIDFVQGLPGVPNLDVEFLFLLYQSSENLVKQSSRLTWLTLWLAITASAMTGLALVQWLEYLSR